MKAYKQSCYNTSTMYSPRGTDNLDFKIEDYLKAKTKSGLGSEEAYLIEIEHESEISQEITQRFHVNFQMNHKLEESFISSGNDLLIARHLRYLPAFLLTHSFFEIVCLLTPSLPATSSCERPLFLRALKRLFPKLIIITSFSLFKLIVRNRRIKIYQPQFPFSPAL